METTIKKEYKMISMDKKYKTRDGRSVRIYALDGEGNYPVQGAIPAESGWEFKTWNKVGDYYLHLDKLDLVEVKPRIQRTFWVNVYVEDGQRMTHRSKESADRNAVPGRLACIKIEIDCAEGEGLD